MKKQFLLLLLLVCFRGFTQTSYVWNGSSSTAWSTSTNWTPNGIPGSVDNVTIVTGANNCVLAGNTNITNLTVTSGLLNLNGFLLTGSGNLVFTSGTVSNGTLTVNAGTGNTAGFVNTTLSANATLNVTTGAITLSGGLYNGPVSLNQTGAVQTTGVGGATFNNTLLFVNSGTNHMRINGNCTFNGVTTFSNVGTGYFLPELASGNTYNSTLNLINNSTSNLRMAYLGATTINGNLLVNNLGSGNVEFCEQATATCSLTAGNTIAVGSIGFNSGRLLLRRFTQLGSTTQSIVTTGTSYISITNNCLFNGTLYTTAPSYILANSIYQGPVYYTKTGATSDATSGGNVYNSTLTVNHNGTTGYWSFANGSADTYNHDVYSNNNSSERIIFGHSSTGNLFNGDIIVTQIGSSQGTALTWNTGATATLASGKTILIGSSGFNVGYLYLQGLTQVGATPINLTFAGATSVYLGPSSTFAANVSITAPDIYARGATYNSPVVFTKTGGTSNHNNGAQNIFNSTLDIIQQSSTGYFMLGYNSNDQFNDDVTLTSTGSGGINLGWSSGTGNPTLASGKKLLIGTGGFSSGYLRLGGFVQVGPTINNITLTGSSVFYINPTAANSVFNGSLTVTAPDLWIGGGTFNSPVSFIKTGGVSNHNQGYQNIFNSTLNVDQQSNGGYFMLSYNANDVYNDDITVSSSGSGGINFGWTNAVGSPTLVAGKTILVGSSGFSAGYLALNKFTQLGNAPINLNFTGTSTYARFAYNSLIGGDLNITTPSVFFDGATFSGSVSCLKTGGNNDNSTGGNIFQGISTFTNSGSGQLLFGNVNPDTWNSDVTFSNLGTHYIYLCWNSTGNIFNGNISLNSSVSALGIQFCSGAAATATISAGNAISTGSYNGGYLILQRITQLGTAPNNLTLTSTASYLRFGPSSSLGGNVVSISPGLFFNGCNFNGTTDCTKTGASGDYSLGGNVFGGLSKITNSGSSFLLLGNNNPDVWNNDVIFTNTGSERILPCWATVGNTFNGDIYVNTSGSAQGIQFCGGNSTATATLAATKSIYTGTLGLNAGYLILKQFTQLGSASINLTLGPTATYLQFGPLSLLGGNVTSTSPGLFFNGCTFNGVVNCTKNGATNDNSSGTNIFNNAATMTNSGAGYLLLANGNIDQFNSTSTFNNTGSSHIYIAHNSTGNIFGGVVTLNNSPSATNSWIYFASYGIGNSTINGNVIVTNNNGAGVYFGSNSGTSTLTAGNSISIGAGGFNSGQLIFRQFTQAGSTAQSFTTTGTSLIQYGPTSQFDGNVTTASPRLLFNGCTFNGIVNCAKNGATTDASAGSNIFNAASSFTNSGSGYLLFGNGNIDQFNSTSSFNNTGSNHIYVAYNGTGNVFGGAVTLNNSPSATNAWIYFGSYGVGNSIINGNLILTNNNGAGISFGSNTGTSTLSAGNSISIGAGGFNSGQLIFRQFTQAGTTVQSFTTTGTSGIYYGPTSTFDGNLTSVSPALFFQGCVFNGITSCTKNGTTNDASVGGNVFNTAASFINNGTGYLLMTNSTADSYYGNVLFEKNNTGLVYPNYNTNCVYFGDVTIKTVASTSITFGANTGIATFSGSASQSINKIAGSENPIFARLVLDKSSNNVTLNTKINITSSLTLTGGLLNTSSSTILNMNNSSGVGIGNASSYVNGPMNYDMAFNGSRTLNMPLGKGSDWRPAILVAAHNNGTSYTYNSELFNANANALGWSYPTTINLVSLVHYWDINRVLTSTGAPSPTTNVSGTQTITLFYGANDGVTMPSALRIAKNTYTATTSWIDIGGTGSAATSGSITSTSSPSNFNSYSRITLANHISGNNPLPIELLSFEGVLNDEKIDLKWITSSELNNDRFEVEKSSDGIDFKRIETRSAYGNGNSQVQQIYQTADASPNNGINYYRLKQIDKNGEYSYSSIISVIIIEKEISIYPNAFADELHVDIGSNSTFGYKIYNNVGQLIRIGTNEFNKTVINTADMIPGIYHLQIEFGQQAKTVKVIKY